jgi:hypothetical protein
MQTKSIDGGKKKKKKKKKKKSESQQIIHRWSGRAGG